MEKRTLLRFALGSFSVVEQQVLNSSGQWQSVGFFVRGPKKNATERWSKSFSGPDALKYAKAFPHEIAAAYTKA